MSKFIITDNSKGAQATGIVIRKHGHYINCVSTEDELKDFMKNNLPLGTFHRHKDGKTLTPVQDSHGNTILTSRDENGVAISIEDLAKGLGFSFERIPSDSIRTVAAYA